MYVNNKFQGYNKCMLVDIFIGTRKTSANKNPPNAGVRGLEEHMSITEEKDLKPNGSFYMLGISSLVSFALGIFELFMSVSGEGKASELSIFFVFMGLCLYSQSKDELGLLKKLRITEKVINIGCIVCLIGLTIMLVARRI